MRNYKSVGYKRRQYEDIARILGRTHREVVEGGHTAKETLRLLAIAFVRLFENDNARFNVDTFNSRVAEYVTGKRDA